VRISVESISALERGVRRAPHRETVPLRASALELGNDQRIVLVVMAFVAASRADALLAARQRGCLKVAPGLRLVIFWLLHSPGSCRRTNLKT
jgi:hypothetical protein